MNTYAKLRDDSWGVKVRGSKPVAGARVSVTKKSGQVKVEIVDAVLWSSSDGTEHLCKIRADESSSGRERKFECSECGDYVYPGSRCWETGATH